MGTKQDDHWQEGNEIIWHVTRYRENVDLSTACRAITPQIDAIVAPLTSLDSASSSDSEAQLKRALFKYAQTGWQNAFAKGRVSYQLGGNQVRVEACATRSVALSTSGFLPLQLGLIVAAIEILGISVLVALRWRRSQHRVVK